MLLFESSRAWKLIGTLAVLCIAIFLSPQAHASCAADPMDAQWVNYDGETRSLTRIRYVQECHDVVHCPDGDCLPPPNWIGNVTVFGACSPTDCAWGNAKVYRHSSGWRYAVFEQGFAKKTVWLRLLPSGQLQTATFANYVDPARADRWFWDEFVRPL